jgi:hypothetical protein
VRYRCVDLLKAETKIKRKGRQRRRIEEVRYRCVPVQISIEEEEEDLFTIASEMGNSYHYVGLARHDSHRGPELLLTTHHARGNGSPAMAHDPFMAVMQ